MTFFSSLGRRPASQPVSNSQKAPNGASWEGVAIQFAGLNIEGHVVRANHGLFTVTVNGPLPVETEQIMHVAAGAAPSVTTRVRVVFCERQIIGDSEYLALVA